jgi:hypothetical protein
MVKPNDNPPIIVDIDLTLTSEWYYNDHVVDLQSYSPMLELVLELQEEGVPIVVSTARPERLREDSMTWLRLKGVFPEGMYMRAEHDNRPDHLSKEDQAKVILEKYGNVLVWYDDNEDNCRVAQSLGIQCLLVKQGRKELPYEIRESKAKILREVKRREEKRNRKRLMANMSAMHSSVSSITTREQENLANFMVEQLKAGALPWQK